MDSGFRIALLGGIELIRNGKRISLPLGAQRLLAFLALQDRRVDRTTAAEQLWPDSPARRAAANLRSALWQLKRVDTWAVVDSAEHRLCLAAAISVDIREVFDKVRRLTGMADFDPAGEGVDLIDALRRELLPNWSDEWLITERERWDQMRMHALETLADRFRTADRYLAALQAALAAIAIEPMRESAHRAAIEVHIAEGNPASALRHYQRYRALLHRELGVAPSPRMTRLVRTLIGT
jgi:DNA-binding SARP family transcriptional activator